MPFLSSVTESSTAPLSQVRRAFAIYDTPRHPQLDGGSRLNQRDQGPDGHVSPKIEVLATAGNTESKGSMCADPVPEAGLPLH